MKTFSEDLRDARIEKGFTLEDLARTTKISLNILKALETGDFEVLPQTYIKGFLRTYAREIGLDENAIVNAFEAHRKATREVFLQQQEAERRPRRRPPWLIIGGLAGICLIIVAGYFLWPSMAPQRRPEPRMREEPVQPPTVATDSSLLDAGQSDTATAASLLEKAVRDTDIIAPAQDQDLPGPDLAEPPQAPVQEEELDIRRPEPTELILMAEGLSDTWLSVLSDGVGVYEGIMGAHASATWRADSLFVLKIGRADGVRLILNGQVLGDLGASDQVVAELVLNKGGVVKKTLR